MPTLQDLLQNHLTESGISVRKLAEQAEIGYQALLGVVNKGTVPRKASHRNALQDILGLDDAAWDAALHASEGAAASGPVPVPETGPVTLQQLVARELATRGLDEKGLAEVAEVPYPTVLGITRRGTIPRTDTIKRVAAVLDLDVSTLDAAIETSRQVRRGGGQAPRPKVAEAEDVPVLAELVAETIRKRHQSMGSFSRDVGVGYLVIARLIERGVIPQEQQVLDALRDACEVTQSTFTAVLEASQERPGAAVKPQRDDLLSPDATALQRAMVGFMRDNNLNLKTLAKRASLSQVTVSRLVKGGQLPSRSATHHKLQTLLGIDAPSYRALLEQSSPTAALTAKPGAANEVPRTSADTLTGEDDTDHYLPHDHTPPQGIAALPDLPPGTLSPDGKPPTTEELSKLMRRLDGSQREALRAFLRSIT